MVTSNLPAVHVWQTASFQICFSNMKHVISYYEVHQVFMNKLCESDENVTVCMKKKSSNRNSHTWWLTCCFARSLLPANNFNNINFFLNNKQFKLCSCIQISFTGLRHRFQRHQMSIEYCYWPIFTIFIDISVGICKWESPSYLSVTESVVLVYV